jgi:hypothetical protein
MLLRAAARRGTAAAAGARALSAAPVIPGGLAEGAADRYVGGRRPDSEKEREGAGMPAEQVRCTARPGARRVAAACWAPGGR